jgi:hypothetical protein
MKLAIEILNDYPIATEIVREWFLKRMRRSFEEDNVSDEFKEGMLKMGVPDSTLAIMLDQSPRNFFDVLDENGICVTIDYESRHDTNLAPTLPDKKIFTYQLNHLHFHKEEFDNRVSCERAAVVKALEMLNLR